MEATTGVVGIALAVGGWNCSANDVTTHSAAVSQTAQTAATTSAATFGNFSAAGAAGAWAAGDILNVACQPY